MRRTATLVQAAIAALATASCAADNQARMVEAARQEQIAKIVAADDAECRGYRLTPGSQPYLDCRMAISKQRGDPDDLKAAAGQLPPRL